MTPAGFFGKNLFSRLVNRRSCKIQIAVQRFLRLLLFLHLRRYTFLLAAMVRRFLSRTVL